MKKLLLSIALVACCLTVLLAQPCLPEGITFTTQAEIDSFQINYPGCTEIEGDVKIGSYGPSGTDISNLDSLYVLTTIGGDLTINGNNITNLSGLENLISVDESLTIHSNQYLADLTGLSGLENIGGDFDIHNCIALISLMGMENLINIGGNLTIGDFDYGNPLLTNLQGLEGISTIQGNIIIHNNNNLSCLLGLDNIVSVGNHVSITNNGDLADLTSLSNLTSIGGSLSILHNSMNNLSGLEGVDSIPGVLWVGGNINLTNLSGLENLTYTGGLAIGNNSVFMGCGNPLLTDLVALENLAMVEGNIEISTNISLNCLNGLGSIAAGSIENVKIDNNSQLTQCNVQSICEYLVSPNGFVEIYDNGTGCNSQQEVEEACNSCLPEGITFSTQVEIDNFQTNYPGCTEIEGDVIISGSDIISLSSLSVLTSITGNLGITYNNVLQDLTGLENLSFIGGDLFLWENDSLENLSGLENLTNIEGNLQIGAGAVILFNPVLTSLSGLDNLNHVGNNLYIYYCTDLIDVTALNSVTSIGGDIDIRHNASLSSLSGLNNIDANSIDNLTISMNFSLSVCEVESICDYLSDPNGTVTIHSNALGCNSFGEVWDACYTDMAETITGHQERLTIIPNPLESRATITYTLHENSYITLQILDLSGREMVTLVNEVQQQGEQKVVFNTAGLPSGIYFCVLKTNKGIQTIKLIKL